ncbi:MAG: c-type cytochrome [Microcystaceae cyanobacterium]
MDKTLTSSKLLESLKVLLIASLLVASLLGVWSLLHHLDPYSKDVLSRQGNLSHGQAIFESNCTVCHGLDGRGNIGPTLQNVSQRKSPPRLIKQVISGQTPPMPKFQPDTQTMADLLIYLESL